MKKFMMIALVMAGSAVMFSSCKKDHTCDCGDGVKYTYSKTTKKKAKEACDLSDKTFKAMGGSCKLK
jgi:hypothetical protein